MAVFTLEAVDAGWGDALLLHWSGGDEVHSMLVDGGPGGDFTLKLIERLGALHDGRDRYTPYRFERAVATHIDADHITGVLEILCMHHDDFEFGGLWHNSFGRVLDEDDPEVVRTALTAFAELAPDEFTRLATDADHQFNASFWTIDETSQVVTASVNQGIDLYDEAIRLGMEVNEGDDLLMAPRPQIDSHDLCVTVVSPTQALLDKLRDHWKTEREKQTDPREAMRRVAAAYDDTWPPNLASIAFHAESAHGKALLTGDARGDLVLEGLGQLGLLGDEPLQLDFLKLPHHGSVRNCGSDFFERLHARHYVVSANGRYGNPDDQTLRWLIESRSDDDFTIWFTNRDSTYEPGLHERLAALFDSYWSQGRVFQVQYRDEGELSVRVELDEPIPW